MKAQKNKDLIYAKKPESVGVDSTQVQALLDDFIASGQNVHSLMILRHGKVACEIYREPYNKDCAHTMYSVSKSVTSTAIGFAVAEGLIELDSLIIDIFPEYRPKKTDENLEMLTVRHLLTMTSGKTVSPLANKEKNWLQNFFSASWYAKPGEKFLYVNENIYVLCAIIHRITGKSVVEYLTPRLFEPLGIDPPFWETCPDGIEAGGWGLFLKTRDMAKIMLCYQQMGLYNGERILPEAWVREATAFQSDSGQTQSAADSIVGYGFCFWRCAGYENAYRADGLFSQFGFVFEDLDACLICTGGDIGTQAVRDTIWRHVPACFIPNAPRKTTTPLVYPAYEMLPVKSRSNLEAMLNDKKISFGKNRITNAIGFPIGIITLPSILMEKDRGSNIDEVVFHFYVDQMSLSWKEGEQTNTVMIGLDGQYRISPVVIGGIAYTAYSHAAWMEKDRLTVRIRLIETIAERILDFTFRNGKVILHPSSLPTIQQISETFKSKIRDVIKQPVIQPLLTEAIPKLASVVDFPLHGSIEGFDIVPDEEDEDEQEEERRLMERTEQLLRIFNKKGKRKEDNEEAEKQAAPSLEEADFGSADEQAEVTGFLSKIIQGISTRRAQQEGTLSTVREIKATLESRLENLKPQTEYEQGYFDALQQLLDKIK